MPSSALLNSSLRLLLIRLENPGSHIVYNTLTKQANLYDGGPFAGSPRVGFAISTEDLLALFENAWITMYDTHDGEHRYHLTESGRRAIG
jgi:hypothetical protein